MKVLIVLEDPTLDQYIVKLLVEKMLDELAAPAQVGVLTNPYMRGVQDVFGRLDEIVEDNPMIDVFIVVIDRDCDRTSHTRKLSARVRPHAGRVLGCLAREEVEVWMLAAQRSLPAPWSEIRSECDPKERYAEPWLAAQGFTSADVGHGRKHAMRALARNLRRVISRCEELRELSNQLRDRRWWFQKF